MKFTNPTFCVIAPTPYLNQYGNMGGAHLCLAHLVDTDEQYAAFYARDAVGFTMMDNSAFELLEPYKPERLVELGRKCRADAIVLPDHPFKPYQITIDAAKEWIPFFKDAGFKTFFVPQSETGDLEGYIKAYDWAVNNPDVDIIGMSILGIPNALPHIHKAYARVVMAQILKERGYTFEKHHHWLGLNSGPALEIPSLLNLGILDTCDSSNPVWTAILGHRYNENTDSFLAVSKPKHHVDFNCINYKDANIHNNIQHNISLTMSLFNN